MDQSNIIDLALIIVTATGVLIIIIVAVDARKSRDPPKGSSGPLSKPRMTQPPLPRAVQMPTSVKLMPLRRA